MRLPELQGKVDNFLNSTRDQTPLSLLLKPQQQQQQQKVSKFINILCFGNGLPGHFSLQLSAQKTTVELTFLMCLWVAKITLETTQSNHCQYCFLRMCGAFLRSGLFIQSLRFLINLLCV